MFLVCVSNKKGRSFHNAAPTNLNYLKIYHHGKLMKNAVAKIQLYAIRKHDFVIFTLSKLLVFHYKLTEIVVHVFANLS